MMDFLVKPDGGEPYELTAHARDVLLWERAGRDRAFSDFAKRLTMVNMYSLAYFAAKRQGLWTGTLAEFEERVDLETTSDDEDEEGDQDPTHEGP
jgi:hypothetical protein